MEKEQKILALVLAVMAVLAFIFGKYKESLKINAAAAAAVNAINVHYSWFESGLRYKDKTAHYPDTEIYSKWQKIPKGARDVNPSQRAREIFAETYARLDYQIPGSYLTEALAFTDGAWSYVIHYDKARAGMAAEGLVTENSDINGGDLSFILSYRTAKEGEPQQIETKCLPYNKEKLKVCKKTFDLLKKANNKERWYLIPTEVNVNTVRF